MSKLSIRGKLIVLYISTLVIVTTLVILGLTSVVDQKNKLNDLVATEFWKLDLVLELRAVSALETGLVKSYLLNGDPDSKRRYLENKRLYFKLSNKLKNILHDDAERKLFAAITKLDEQNAAATTKAIKVFESTGDAVKADKQIPSTNLSRIDSEIFALEEVVEDKAAAKVGQVKTNVGRVITAAFILTAILLLAMLLGGYWVAVGFTDVTNKLSDGSAQLSSSSSEIATVYQEMSRGLESQLSQVIDTSSAMEEMSLSIKEVSQSAKGASESATKVSDQVIENTERLKETISGVRAASDNINKLKQRSEEIGKIIKLISEIASQTNILALNAAIEAARAGEYGKGFDVVAEEIRKLAQRTAQSTAEIAPMIEEIQKETQDTAARITNNVEMAEAVGTNFDVMSQGIMQATAMTRSISIAAEQQAKTAEQIADSLQVISGVSRETAKSADETTGATRDLAELSQSLREVIRHLKAS